MKKKIVIALIATLTLTLGTFGTAFAMNSNPKIELQTNQIFKQGGDTEEHTHTWSNAQYVVDKPAVYEQNWVVDKEAVYEQIKVVDKPAEYEQIKVVDKPAEYEQIKVVDKPAWDEEITDVKTVCYLCQNQGINTYFANGKVEGTDISIIQHCKDNHGGASHYGQEEVVVDVIHHEEVFHYEQGALISPEEFHYEQGALISPEEWHYENGALISPEEGHYENGDLISPEEGHWEHTCTVCGEIQNRDTGEVIKPGTLPEEPENPGTDEPDTEEPENPNTGDNTGDQTDTPSEDTENPTDETEKDNNKQDQLDNTDKTTTESTTKNDKTAQTTDNKEQADTATTVESNKNTAPQTGDTANLLYLATLAGSAVTGGTAFGLRRKFKK